MICIFLLLISELFIFLLSYALNGRDILSPSCTMCIMFIVSTIFTILNINKWKIEFSFESFLILASGLFVFTASTVLFNLLFSKKEKQSLNVLHCRKAAIPQPQLFMIFCFILFDIVACFWYYKKVKNFVGVSGYSFSSIVASYRRIRVENLASGSSEDAAGGILSQLLKIVKASGHVAAFFLVYSYQEKRKYSISHILGLLFITILSMVPSVLVASRGEFLKFFSFLLIVFYISWQQKYGWRRVLSWKVIRIGIIGLLTGIPIFYYSAELIGRSNTYNIMDYVSTYIGGSIQLFNQYIKEPVNRKVFGEESFVGISKIISALGLGEMSSSTNLEFRQLGMFRSNVYTFFRRPLHDFGLFGMYLFTVLVAMLFSYIYYGKIKNKCRTRRTDKWVLVYGYLYYWMVLSSIDQYSQSYVSIGAVLIIILITVVYDLFTKVRLSVHNTE